MLFTVFAAYAVVLSIDGARVSLDEIKNLLTTDEVPSEEISNQCPRTISEVEEPLKTYFDNQRVQMDLLDLKKDITETCTKKDVCLLMRQLDMDFYQRARAGTLTDMDFDTLPDLSWMSKGTCVNAEKSRGKRYVPVIDMETCAWSLNEKGIKSTPEEVNDDEHPAGCSITTDNNKGKTTAYMNIKEDSKFEAGRVARGGQMSRFEVDLNIEVLCEHDRSLSEAAATYYSPYKLKPSMVAKPELSTSCSFGMYAYLAYLKQTESSCAKILTYKTSGRFYSAQAALDKAKEAEKEGKADMAEEIRGYVEDVRQKFVLIDTIANNWCPGVWNAALAPLPGAKVPGTCQVPRKSSWAENGTSFLEEYELEEGEMEPRPRGGRPGGQGGGRKGTVKGGPAAAGNIARLQSMHQMLDEEEELAALLAGDAVERVKAPANMVDSNGKPIKMAISEDFCERLEDETLASILANVPTAPPDFFRDASVPDGEEHPKLGPKENEKWVKSK